MSVCLSNYPSVPGSPKLSQLRGVRQGRTPRGHQFTEGGRRSPGYLRTELSRWSREDRIGSGSHPYYLQALATSMALANQTPSLLAMCCISFSSVIILCPLPVMKG